MLPSGLNATLVTPSVCPLSVRVPGRSAASHTFTVLSSLAEASRLPSGLNATPDDPLVCPLRVRVSWPGRGVPHLHRIVVAGASSRVREPRLREPSGLNATLVTLPVCPLRVSGLLARRGVPHLYRLVPTGGGEAGCRRG